jgi:hypothetical protein
LYTLDFFWTANPNSGSRNRDPYYDQGRRDTRGDGVQTRGRANDRAGYGEMIWTGTVDQEAVVEIRGRRAMTRTVRGQRVLGERAEFSSAMPRNAMVRIEDAQGRGRVELVQQPDQYGGVALVRILDDQGGAAQYSFKLVWDDGSGAFSGSGVPSRTDPYHASQSGVLTPGSGGYGNSGYGNSGSGAGANLMRWSGRVDGRVRVSVQGDRAWTTRVQGGPVVGEQVNFGGALPNRNLSDVNVRKLQGRNDVQMIQRPSPENGYTFIFEINDSDSGADDYVVEVNWR